MREREEVERAIFLDKCAKGQLLIQRMAFLEEAFLKPIPISGPREHHLHFNDRLGLLCPSPVAERVRVNHSRERPSVIIAVDLDESLIYGPMKLSEGVTIVASTMVKPVARSIFQVTSREACPSECKVTYETPVQFMLADEGLSNTPLYMASDTVTSIGATNSKSGQRRVFMHADKQDYNTLWKFQHVDPRVRLEFEGLPVPAMSGAPSDPFICVALPLALGLCLRSLGILQPYSGMSSPPMFGDYEAQRHWMEITVNLPISEWYVNTSSNDLQYWGLDYPPVTAYHSYILGQVSKLIDPAWTELFISRGLETPEHKRFMRLTVIVSDCLSYMLAALFYCAITLKRLKKDAELSGFSVALSMMSFPGLILLDHGHFQYNCVSLGLFVMSLVFFSEDLDVIGSVVFCLAFLYKQMELYHALPVFFFLLSKCFSHSFAVGFKRVAILAATVFTTFLLVFLPFLTSLDQLKHVGLRVFPVDRGLFEDKVANFWCISSVLIKWRQIFTANVALYICCLVTLLTSLPACLSLFRRPSISRFILTEAIVSLSFFLFSYQVHEKSVLLVAIPVLCLLPIFPLSSYYFLFVSTLSMWPLFYKDRLCYVCVALVIIFYAVVSICLSTDSTGKHRVSLARFWPLSISLIGYAIIFALQFFVQPPVKYPFLFQLFVNAYSFFHFSGFYVFWSSQLVSLE
ncbi:Dolichyl pyrophosphate Man9GlcNAc2 alpha-1,3-glucosyltransferase [Echinococcus granulosus]|nr:Dolichyl pyrophosphate Man9GlcNAc2 alpha-1,3-glucosyltransferase [Echinococcus granulosus]